MIEVTRRARPATVLIVALLVASCGEERPEAQPQRTDPQSGLPRGVLVIQTEAGELRLDVEIAETTEAKTRGLMGRTELADHEGMVFLEEQPVQQSFWMKDTLIPLTLAVWGPDERIAGIVEMEPCRKEPCPVYDPGAQWVGAVEVNPGVLTGVEIGDPVRLQR